MSTTMPSIPSTIYTGVDNVETIDTDSMSTNFELLIPIGLSYFGISLADLYLFKLVGYPL